LSTDCSRRWSDRETPTRTECILYMAKLLLPSIYNESICTRYYYYC